MYVISLTVTRPDNFRVCVRRDEVIHALQWLKHTDIIRYNTSQLMEFQMAIELRTTTQ